LESLSFSTLLADLVEKLGRAQAPVQIFAIIEEALESGLARKERMEVIDRAVRKAYDLGIVAGVGQSQMRREGEVITLTEEDIKLIPKVE